VISAFEIGLKYRSGKLKLPAPPLEWDVCVTATKLPDVHRDPCDRFIIATARLHGLPVITGDPHFSAYGIDVLS
jgi:PIN domain nuclease of toxin-antitoxin system